MSAIRITGAALLAAAVLSACATENTPTSEATAAATGNLTGHNASDHFSSTTAVSFEVENPCNGEVITLSGQAVDQMTFVDTREHLDDGFSLHSEYQAVLSLTGTGPVTGAPYTVHDVFHEMFESPSPPAPDFTFSSHETLNVISQPPGQGFLIHSMFHIVGLPDGSVRVTRDNQTLECRN